MPTYLSVSRRTFSLVVVLLLLLTSTALAATRLPRATITVHPATHVRAVTQEITLSRHAPEPDFVRFILPAKVVEADASEHQTFTRAGATTSADFARGTLKLINKQDEEQRLLPRTHLRHEGTGVFLLTDAATIIPPQSETTITVTAKEKGVAGNVPAGKFIIDKLPSSLQNVIYAESATEFTGGIIIDDPLSVPELEHAKSTVQAAARARVAGELTAAAGGATTREELTTITITDENASADVGSRAPSFTVQARLQARAFVADDNDLLSLTLLALRSSPRPDEEFTAYDPSSFKLEIVRADLDRGEALVKGTLNGTFADKTSPTLFTADNLAGRTPAEVAEYFKQFPSVGSIEVAFAPFWVKTVPARPAATTILIKNE